MQFHLPAPGFGWLSKSLSLTLLPEATLDRRIGIQPEVEDPSRPESDALSYALDVATEISLSEAPPSRGNSVLIALKKLLRNGIDDSVRAADFIEKRQTREGLQHISGFLLRSGCSTSAFLFLWVIHLLEYGSVRLATPTIGTIRTYVFSEIDRIHDRLIEAGGSPANRSDEEWRGILESLLQEPELSGVRINALASFHRFLVIQFGIEPQSDLFNKATEECVPRANALWPHQIANAFNRIAKTTNDPRLQKMMGAILALGVEGIFRIGEVPSLRLSNVKVDATGDGIYVAVRPGRQHHKGKSNAAAKIIKLSISPYRHFIEEWLKQRDIDAADVDADLLFGDPNFPHKCYRMGMCIRLINKILKEATGDPTISFHTLRHSNIGSELLLIFLASVKHTSISATHRLMVAAAHQSEITTYESYFHRPEVVVRHYLDKAVRPFLASPAIVAKWTDVKANTLGVSRGRSKSPEMYFSQVLHATAQQGLAGFTVPVVPEVMPLSDQMDLSGRVSSFQFIFNILRGIYSKLTPTVVASRNDTTEACVMNYCRHVIQVAASLRGFDPEKFPSAKANDEVTYSYTMKLIQEARLHCHFTPDTEQALEPLRQYFQTLAAPTVEISEAIQAWQICKRGVAISAVKSDRLDPLLKLCKTAGLVFSNFILRVQVSDPTDSKIQAMVLQRSDVTDVLTLFHSMGNTAINVDVVKFAQGRPDLYLMLSRARLLPGKAAESAQCRMNRWHALMLTAAVWVLETKNTGGTRDGGN